MRSAKAFTRVGCLLLCLLLLLGCVSCATRESVTYLDRDLAVEEAQVIYTEAFVSDAAERLSALYCRIMPLMGGPTLTDSDKESVLALMRDGVLPVGMRVRISEAEWSRILTYAAALETELTAEHDPMTAFGRYYQQIVAILGHVRAGELLYYSTVLYLEHSVALCEERYRNYGYEGYLEEARLYRQRLTDLRERLDADTFGKATRVAVYMLSFLTGIDPQMKETSASALLYDGEVLLMLRMQADEFAELGITAEQWQILVSLYAGLAPQRPDTPMEAELFALQDAGIFAGLSGAMPELLALYRGVMYSITEAEVALLRSNAPSNEKSATICRALSENEQQLRALLARFEVLTATNDGAAERRAMERVGRLVDCERFLSETEPLDIDALISVITDHDGSAHGEQSLKDAVIGYLRGVMPYLAFALSEEVI